MTSAVSRDRQLADIDRHLHAVRTSTSECRDETGDLLRVYRAATIRLIAIGVAQPGDGVHALDELNRASGFVEPEETPRRPRLVRCTKS